MPIYEAAKSLVLHFGYGDITVANGRNAEKDYEDEICFVRQEPHAIGEENAALIGKATDAIDCTVRLIFDKIESLDVVIEELQRLREKMTARTATT